MIFFFSVGFLPLLSTRIGLGVSTLQDPPSKNLRVGHPSRLFNFSTLEGFEDFDVAFFAEDIYGDAGGVAVDDYVTLGARDA